MDLRELGALLREERERRGLTIEQVSDEIKITRTCITAIEDGNEDCLPHPVYARGFIKNYAKLLGMDHGEFQESLARIYRSEELPLRDVPLMRGSDAEEGGTAPELGGAPGHRLTVALAGGVGLIVLIALGWYLYATFFAKPVLVAPPGTAVSRVEEPVQPEEAPVTPATPAPDQTQPQVAEPVQSEQVQAPLPPAETKAPPKATPDTETAASVAPTKPENTAAAELSAEDRATQDIAMSGVQNPTAQTAIPAAPAVKQFTVGEHGDHVVRITANERCWLQAGVDGGTMRETMLEPGDTFLGRFTGYLLVRLGNAGGVDIQFDGKLYPFRASKGSVKTLKFVGRTGETAIPSETEKIPAAVNTEPSDTASAADKPAVVGKPAVADKPTAASETPVGDKTLEVYAQDGSWVILLPDKGPAKEIYVKKGQRLTVPFVDKINVKLGNPSNLVFRYEGKETPVTTERGEAKTLHFP